MKNLAFQTEINRFKWLQLTLNIVLGNLGILTAASMISLVDFGNATVLLDLTLTNLLLIFFMFWGGRTEMLKWRIKHIDSEAIDLGFSARVKQFAGFSTFKAYMILLAGFSITVTVPFWLFLFVTYGNEIPQLHMLGFKTFYSAFLAYKVAVFGCQVGGISKVPQGLIDAEAKSKAKAEAKVKNDSKANKAQA